LAAGAVEFTSDKCILKECTFEAFGTSTQITVQLGPGASQSILKHLSFFDNDSTNTSNSLYVQSGYNTIFDIKFEGLRGGLFLSGSYNIVSLLASRYSRGIDLTCSGAYNVISQYVVYTDTSYDGGGFVVSGDRNRLYGFSLAMSNDNDALIVPSGADDNTFSHFLLNNSGQDGSNAYNAVEVGGDRNSFDQFSITGVCDKYPFEILSTADYTKITNSDSSNATGSVSNTVYDGGTNTMVLNYCPTTVPNMLPNPTTCYSTLTVNGTFYYNACYAIGHADDVAVTVTGSTETFTISDPTWHADIVAKGFTVSGASATYSGLGGAGKIFKIHGIFDVESDTASMDIYAQVWKNGAGVENSLSRTYLQNASQTGNVSSICFVELDPGDILDFRLSGSKSATLTHTYATFSIHQIN